MGVKRFIPWQAKIIGKLICSRIPLNYGFWQQIGLFRHGQMKEPEYACQVFKKHYDRAVFSRKGRGFTTLECGCGDSLFSALIANAFGGSGTYMVDAGRFAGTNMAPYRRMAEYLSQQKLPTLDLSPINSIDEMLVACNSHYYTEGINSLREIPDSSIDFIWSHAVLEHLRRSEFLDMMRELKRVLRPDGACSHLIDLQDHIGGALNNLRFPAGLWESDFMSKSGFYTNRLRCSEMLELFKKAGFKIEMLSTQSWDKLPTRLSCLARDFRGIPEKELLIFGFDVVLRHK